MSDNNDLPDFMLGMTVAEMEIEVESNRRSYEAKRYGVGMDQIRADHKLMFMIDRQARLFMLQHGLDLSHCLFQPDGVIIKGFIDDTRMVEFKLASSEA